MRIIDRNADVLLGPLALYRWDDGLTLTWRAGFVREAVVEHKERAPDTLLDRLLSIPAVEALDAVRVGWAGDFEACARTIVARRPPLRTLAFGIDENGSPLFETGDLGDLLTSLPNLETFVGPGGEFRSIRLPNVRSFTLLGRTDIDTLIDAKWPRLERLRLYVNRYHRFGDVQRLIDALAAVPTLEVLELVDDEYDDWMERSGADELLAQLAPSALLSQLSKLALDGAVSIAGVRAILDAALVESLRRALRGVDVRAG